MKNWTIIVVIAAILAVMIGEFFLVKNMYDRPVVVPPSGGASTTVPAQIKYIDRVTEREVPVDRYVLAPDTAATRAAVAAALDSAGVQHEAEVRDLVATINTLIEASSVQDLYAEGISTMPDYTLIQRYFYRGKRFEHELTYSEKLQRLLNQAAADGADDGFLSDLKTILKYALIFLGGAGTGALVVSIATP